ncbi:ABC transporter permease [Nocardioides bruguierae]|uniref:ABC transporter permease n=1 Tax=Nocardioides bruguierae TaxID=2945102 RepID=UPI00201FE482|nr:ABC transporter permease [Nocardioides bruguierae]MCL8025322.1 ABC transporter permease [Nocardioides bruguierae]
MATDTPVAPTTSTTEPGGAPAPGRGPGRLRGATRFARSHPFAVVATVVLVLYVVMALVGSTWSDAAYDQDPALRLQGPSSGNLLGTDDLGRDLFARIAIGARTSLAVGALVTVLAVALGIVTGLATGYSKAVDATLSRLIDGVLAFPAFLFAIAMVSVLGAGVRAEVIALALAFWPRISRVVRSSTLQLKEAPFIEAARAGGSRSGTILFRHILPNAVSPIIVRGTFVFAESILLDAGLSYLGLGAVPPTPSWGNMLSDAQVYLTLDPWFVFVPGIAIVGAVLALNVVGDALRDWLDPHSRAGGRA